jgi:hypothetical protein
MSALPKKNVNMLRIFDIRILRKIYGPITIIVYGEQDAIVSYITVTMNHSHSGQNMNIKVAGIPL